MRPGQCEEAKTDYKSMTAQSTLFSKAPEPPYYAVIFSSNRADGDRGYAHMANRMFELASTQPGFLGVESARNADGFGITVSYWSSEPAITAWKAHVDHKCAQEAGNQVWYADYQVRIAKVERAYGKTHAV
jgi:heme-degrading monooxygenase HmoA